MNDPKAAAAYHPGDAPVVRTDLDALIANLREDPRDLGLILQETMVAAADALEAERARADQAKQRIAALQEEGGWSCLHCGHAAEAHSLHGHPSFECVWEPYWKSAVPTAEQ